MQIGNKNSKQNTNLQQGSKPLLKPIFKAELTPYRSLGRNGFMLLMGFVFFTCFLSGVSFLVIGAWPVFLFMMLDVGIIALAFHLNYRAAQAKEEVAVWQDLMLVRKTAPSGKAREYNFNPFWTRFQIDRHDHIGIVRMAVVGRDQSLDIGSFLNPEDRESFAQAFNAALARVRN